MPGRYFLSAAPADVAAEFEVDVCDDFPPRWNIAPTQPVAVIHIDERRRRAYGLMRWGFIPGWAKKDWHERMAGKPLINARSETAAEKPTFRHAWKRRRCLLPASGYYEWRAENGARQPWRLAGADGGLLAFAGLWETALDPDGGEMDTVAILTTAPGPDIAPLHHREPVVIPPQEYRRWLDPDETAAPALKALMASSKAGAWRVHKVSTRVNSVRSEGADLVAPVGQGELF